MNDKPALDTLLKYNSGNPKVDLEIDRMLLRLYENPALILHLNGVGKSGTKTELDFDTIPDATVDVIKSLIGPIDIEVLTYEVEGRTHIGFRFNAEDLCAK